MIRAFVAACFALLALSTAARAQDAGCFKDTDCKGSRICVEHQCVDAPAVHACARDLDCPGDDICEQHICVPPANAPATTSKKNKGKPTRRDLIKEAQQKAAAQKAAQQAAQAPAPTVVTAPTPAPAEPTPPPEAPPQLIQANPVPSTPPPAPAPAPKPQPVAASPPAQVSAPASTTPPSPPADLLITPPPPLVAAAPPPPSDNTSESSYSPVLWGLGVTAGLHTLSSTNSETDFGLDLNGDVGIRVSNNFGLELIFQGSYTPMLSSGQGTVASPNVSHTSLLGAIGLGVRFDHLGPIPGHFLLGGMGSFAGISSSDNEPTLNLSGGAVLLQYGLPVLGPLEARAQTGFHFLSDGFTFFTLSVGIAIGD